MCLLRLMKIERSTQLQCHANGAWHQIWKTTMICHVHDWRQRRRDFSLEVIKCDAYGMLGRCLILTRNECPRSSNRSLLSVVLTLDKIRGWLSTLFMPRKAGELGCRARLSLGCTAETRRRVISLKVPETLRNGQWESGGI